MKQICILAILIQMSMACSNNAEQNNSTDRELVPYPEKLEHDNYSTLPDSLKPKFRPDTVIGHLSLMNSKNVDSYLGKNIMDKLIKGDDLSHAIVTSSDDKQILTIYFHPGSIQNEFSEFKIEFNTSRTKSTVRVSDKEFQTENGIKLNISVGDLKSIKGEPDTIKTIENIIIYHYKISDFKNSDFLKKYTMPIYYADYSFSNGYLTEFRFGFDYP